MYGFVCHTNQIRTTINSLSNNTLKMCLIWANSAAIFVTGTNYFLHILNTVTSTYKPCNCNFAVLKHFFFLFFFRSAMKDRTVKTLRYQKCTIYLYVHKKRYGLAYLTLDWTEWYWNFTIISVCHLYIGGQKCSFVPFFLKDLNCFFFTF